MTTVPPTGAMPLANRAVLPDPPQGAYDKALASIQACGGQLAWQSPPGAAKFVIAHQSFATTSGIKVNYAGDLTVTAEPDGRSAVTLAASVDWGSAVPVFLIYAVGFVVIVLFNYLLAFLLTVVGIGYTAWTLTSRVPQDIVRQIFAHMAGGYSAPAQPAAAAPPPATPG